MRADSLHALEHTPSLRERIRNGVGVTSTWRPIAKAV
jgi:hypothetical protein